MGLIDRIKRRLPIVGSPAPQPARPAASARPYAPPPEPEEAVEKSPRGGKPVAAFIEETVKGNPIVLFMKGSPSSPQCGFSASAAGILQGYGKPLAHVNVLADEEIREGVKKYTSWPTIPQVFVGGEFVGGADILRQLHDSGELKELIEKAFPGA
ncbi:MAG: Grx4 family monothiol glutaredoxin [Myxococcota bacterium]